MLSKLHFVNAENPFALVRESSARPFLQPQNCGFKVGRINCVAFSCLKGNSGVSVLELVVVLHQKVCKNSLSLLEFLSNIKHHRKIILAGDTPRCAVDVPLQKDDGTFTYAKSPCVKMHNLMGFCWKKILLKQVHLVSTLCGVPFCTLMRAAHLCASHGCSMGLNENFLAGAHVGGTHTAGGSTHRNVGF